MLRLPARPLPDFLSTRASATGAAARGATALGAVATGALAVGSAAVGRLAVGRAGIGRLSVRGARVRRLEIDELVVRDLQLGDRAAAATETVTQERVSEWVNAYEGAWRTGGIAPLDGLFTPDATYRAGPWKEPHRGLDAIKAFWDEERDGPDEPFTVSFEPVAVGGDTAVVRANVEYTAPRVHRWRNLWVIAFAADGRARSFEEWPFAPDGATGDA